MPGATKRRSNARDESLKLECCLAVDHLRMARDLSADDQEIAGIIDASIVELVKVLDLLKARAGPAG